VNFKDDGSNGNPHKFCLDMPLVEDSANFGVWMHLYQSNFFDTSIGGIMRYLYWLSFTLAI